MERPQWYTDQHESLLQRLRSLGESPFDQPADTNGYFSCHHNDYLRLSQHPEVVAARHAADEKVGFGAMASIAYGGDHGYHRAFRSLVAEAAQSEGPDSVLLTTAGWTANAGLVEALAAQNVPIYIDVGAHASLWDGTRFSTGKVVPFTHNSPATLRKFVKVMGSGIIVIDSYYSTNGAIAPIEEFVELADEFNCILVVDEAHSFGLTGEKGGGLGVERGVARRIHYRTVSLAKGLGGYGGLIIADPESIRYLMYRVRPVIFSSSPPPSVSAGHSAAMSVVMREPQRAQQAQEMAAYFRKLLNEKGQDTGPSACQIVSLRFEGEKAVCDLYHEMKSRKVLFSVFLYPAVPQNTSLARFSIYSELTRPNIDYIAQQTVEACAKLGIQSCYPSSKRP